MCRKTKKMRPQKKRITIDDKVIASLDEQAIIAPLWWSVSIYDSEEKYENDLKPFTLPQRYVFAIQWYVAEVCNGGHSQFYDNSTGIVWEDALRGLQEIGATENIDILKESVARMGGAPSKVRETRWEQLEQHNCVFDDLDDRFYASETAATMQALLHKYITKNASAFYFDGEITVVE